MQFVERLVGDVTILDVSGRIMFADGVEGFRAALGPIIERTGVRLVLNMAEVPLIDSAGIGELVRAHTSLSRGGGGLRLLRLTRRVYEALSITRLLTVIEAFDSEDEAVESFRHGTPRD